MSNWNGTAYHLSEADVSSVFNAICSSELVQFRREHCARLSMETRIEIRDDLSINAFASRLSADEIKAQIPKEPEEAKDFIPQKYRVAILQGMLDWISALAVVIAILDRTGSTRKARSMLKWMRNAATMGCVGSDLLLRMWDKFHLEEDSVQEEVARMYAKTILMSVMAHECGHICLGHLSYHGWDMHCSISRNDERQADSWASAVLQSCCLGAQGAVAAVMMVIGLTWAHKISEEELRFSTHPMHMERLEHMIQTFDAMFTVSHITKKQLLELVP
jgi:hypothetical protein